MSALRVEIDPAESIETTCFGQEEDQDWHRAYRVYDDNTPSGDVVEGRLHYTPREDGVPVIHVDYQQVPEEFCYETARDAWSAFKDDEVVTTIILATLPKVREVRELLQEARRRRQAGQIQPVDSDTDTK